MHLAYSQAFSAQALPTVEDIPPEVHIFLLCAVLTKRGWCMSSGRVSLLMVGQME